VDFTLAFGNPDPDLSGAVSPAWMHLGQLCCKKYAQDAVATSASLQKTLIGAGYNITPAIKQMNHAA
jgi:hypothetical protein